MVNSTTTTFHSIHQWNALLCPPIGLLFNLLLILLVLTKTPKEMRLHSRILLQTGIVDILLLLLTTFGQPAFAFQQNELRLIFEGYFIGFFTNYTSLLKFCFIWFTFNTFYIFGLTIQFIYRYLVLNRGVKINLCQYLLMLSAIFFPLAIFHFISYFLQIPNDGANIDSTNDELIWELYKNGSVKFITILYQESWILNICNGIFIIFCLMCFGIIAFCGWKMSRYVNSQLTEQKKKLSKQLTLTLIILAILPLLFLINSNFVVIVNILSKSGQEGDEENGRLRVMELSASLLVHWLPVLNPLVSILTNTPYRRAVFRAMTSRIGPSQQTTD